MKLKISYKSTFPTIKNFKLTNKNNSYSSKLDVCKMIGLKNLDFC